MIAGSTRNLLIAALLVRPRPLPRHELARQRPITRCSTRRCSRTCATATSITTASPPIRGSTPSSTAGRRGAMPSATRPGAQLTYYINAYNAFAIRGILDGYSPATSVRALPFFKRVKFRLDGKEVTLEALEHQRIRALGDSAHSLRHRLRVHCPARDCPTAPICRRRSTPSSTRLRTALRQRRDPQPLRHRPADCLPVADLRVVPRRFRAGGRFPAGFSGPLYAGTGDSRGPARGPTRHPHLPYDWDLNGRLASHRNPDGESAHADQAPR